MRIEGIDIALVLTIFQLDLEIVVYFVFHFIEYNFVQMMEHCIMSYIRKDNGCGHRLSVAELILYICHKD